MIAVARDEEKSIWPVVSFGPSRVHKPTCFTADPRIAVDCGRSDQMNARDPVRTAMCTAVDIECDFPAPWPPRNNQPPIKATAADVTTATRRSERQLPSPMGRANRACDQKRG